MKQKMPRLKRMITMSEADLAQLDAIRAARVALGIDHKMLTRSAVIRALAREALPEMEERVQASGIRSSADVLLDIPDGRLPPLASLEGLTGPAREFEAGRYRELFEAHLTLARLAKGG